MNNKRLIILILTATLAAAASADAAVLNGNWCSVANVAHPPAGIVSWDSNSAHCNDLTAPAGFSPIDSINGTDPDLKFDIGTDVPDGVTLSWSGSPSVAQNTNDNVNRSTDVDDGHDELMTGYLGAPKATAGNDDPIIIFAATGLDAAFGAGTAKDIYLYIDGDDDDTGSDTGEYRAGLWSNEADALAAPNAPALGFRYGRDAIGSQFALANDGTSPLSHFTEVTSSTSGSPTLGNYVKFSGWTGDTFYVEIIGVDDVHGVALNGFEIVPEPGTMVLLGLGGFAALLRRRRRS